MGAYWRGDVRREEYGHLVEENRYFTNLVVVVRDRPLFLGVNDLLG